MRRLLAFSAIGIAALSIVGCSASGAPAVSSQAPNSGDTDVARLEILRAAIDEGDECAELFAVLDQMDEGADAFPTAQGELRNVGCYTRDAERNDKGLAAQALDSPWLGVPGEKVAPSAACIGSAEVAAKELDSMLAEPLIAATLDACTSVDEWMSVLAMYPGVMGMVEGSIPQLLDLQSACYSYVDSAVCQDALTRDLDVGP